MFKVKQVKIDFFKKKNENCDLSLRKRISSCQHFPLNFFFSMFTPRAMFFFPMLVKSSGNNVATKTANFKSI